MKSICGIDCTNCELSGACSGCAATEGRPFGVECLVAQCCKRGEAALDALKKRLIAAFNALHIPDMEEVTELNALKGSFANILYALPNGQIVKFWDDNKIYLGNQLHKKESDRCYGIIADEKYLMVSEYSGFGADADIVVFKQWNDAEDK
ncbi:DUF3795 domain-containing protein [Lachnospiraceae bacterium]|jgi:hypothetical protein|nr:DUF3795 domain-containing protein [Lachnospiraceae bacterium]